MLPTQTKYLYRLDVSQAQGLKHCGIFNTTTIVKPESATKEKVQISIFFFVFSSPYAVIIRPHCQKSLSCSVLFIPCWRTLILWNFWKCYWFVFFLTMSSSKALCTVEGNHSCEALQNYRNENKFLLKFH